MTRSWGMPWPLPALLAWGLCAMLHRALLAQPLPVQAFGGPAGGGSLATTLAVTTGLALALLPGLGSWRRRAVVALGFPLALAVAGLGLPAWAWALALALALLAYPLRAWRDAPLFPTPAGALDGLAAQLPLPPGARVLDAGCGTGDGLRALSRAYPQAEVDGVEHSRLWAAVARWRCRGLARVRRGDLWADAWGEYDLIYLFQRPETMPRAWAKATAEAHAGAWLVSLQFAIPNRQPDAVLNANSRWPLHLYRIGAEEAGQRPSAPLPASTRRARRR